MKNRAKSASLAVAIAATLTMAVLPQAQATTDFPKKDANPAESLQISGPIKLVNAATDRCLDADGGEVYTRPCSAGNNYQIWDAVPANGGVNLHNRDSGLCLWMGNEVVQAVEEGIGCPQANSIWTQHPDSTWRTDFEPNMCLDSNALGEVYGRTCTPNNPFQSWNAVPA